MKAPLRLRLDFVAPVNTAPRTGTALCVAGLVAAIALGVSFDGALTERNRLDAQLNVLTRPAGATTPTATRSAEENAAIERELSVPWSQLLSELALASRDTASTVALLEVQPDPVKHVVQITAEARDLPAALAYLERLQLSKVLRYPMLESHERKKDDPEHPVRIKLAAEWRS